MTAGESNLLADECDLLLDEAIGGRSLSPGLRGAIFLVLNDRARKTMRPAMSQDLRDVVERFATLQPWQSVPDPRA